MQVLPRSKSAHDRRLKPRHEHAWSAFANGVCIYVCVCFYACVYVSVYSLLGMGMSMRGQLFRARGMYMYVFCMCMCISALSFYEQAW